MRVGRRLGVGLGFRLSPISDHPTTHSSSHLPASLVPPLLPTSLGPPILTSGHQEGTAPHLSHPSHLSHPAHPTTPLPPHPLHPSPAFLTSQIPRPPSLPHPYRSSRPYPQPYHPTPTAARGGGPLASPCISLYLPKSPCISLYLPISPCISLPQLEAAAATEARLLEEGRLQVP